MAHCDPAQPTAPRRSDDPVVIALCGRPNAGKSSLYNLLSGGDAHVGNYPGVTVDILEAELTLRSGQRAVLSDLPGAYSVALDSDTDTDEGIARSFLDSRRAEGRRLLLLQVLDGTQLGLHLRLTQELLQRDEPLLCVITQSDVLAAQGRTIDTDLLSRELGAPVLLISARDPAAREPLLLALDALAQAPPPTERGARPALDTEALARRAAHAQQNPDAAQRRHRERSARLDGLLLHPLLGPLCFLLLMTALFTSVFFVADPLKAALDSGKGLLASLLNRSLGAGLASSFLIDGALFGAGTVLTFLPQIVLLTIAMELLEASGYLARGAFLVDRLLRAVGLGGRAFVPLLTGHACAVPAIAATRVIRDPRERLTAILVIPLMTCSARLPTYSLLIATFFAAHGALWRALLTVGLYAAGLASGLFASAVLRRSVTRGRGLPLVMEMPAYRLPQAPRVARVALRAAQRFVIDVGTVILVASLVLWGLLHIPMPQALQRRLVPHSTAAQSPAAARMNRSVAAGIGHALEPITRPLGFDWRINIGLIGSFGARELMVSTLGVTFGLESEGDEGNAALESQLRAARTPSGAPAYGGRTAAALLAFFVLACQCLSTLAAIRRETRSWRWPLLVLVTTYSAGYLLALLVYQGGALFGLS